jgi:hypothetical protein
LYISHTFFNFWGSSPRQSETSPQSFPFRLCPPLHIHDKLYHSLKYVVSCSSSSLFCPQYSDSVQCDAYQLVPEGPACLFNYTFFIPMTMWLEILDLLMNREALPRSGSFCLLSLNGCLGMQASCYCDDCCLARVSSQVSAPTFWGLYHSK